jgi:hypothetical protein
MGVKRVEFYACRHGNQAKEIAKAASTYAGARDQGDSTRRNFFAVRFSTGFAPLIHRFSTAADFRRDCRAGGR